MFVIATAVTRLLVVAVVLVTSLVLGVALIIGSCLVVGVPINNLVRCVAVIIRSRLVQAVAVATIGTRFIVAVLVIATLLVGVV